MELFTLPLFTPGGTVHSAPIHPWWNCSLCSNSPLVELFMLIYSPLAELFTLLLFIPGRTVHSALFPPDGTVHSALIQPCYRTVHSAPILPWWNFSLCSCSPLVELFMLLYSPLVELFTLPLFTPGIEMFMLLLFTPGGSVHSVSIPAWWNCSLCSYSPLL